MVHVVLNVKKLVNRHTNLALLSQLGFEIQVHVYWFFD